MYISFICHSKWKVYPFHITKLDSDNWDENLYAVQKKKSLNPPIRICTCNNGFKHDERDTCAFLLLYASPRPDFEINNYFYIKIHFRFWEKKPRHVHVSDFSVFITVHVHTSQRRAVHTARSWPFRMVIRIYGVRGSTLQGRFTLSNRTSETPARGRTLLREFIFILNTVD